MDSQNELIGPIDWTRDALTDREAKLRAALLRRVEREARANGESIAFTLLTACEELRVLGVPIEMWDRKSVDKLAADVRTLWDKLASDAEAARSAAQERKRQQRFAEAIAEIDG